MIWGVRKTFEINTIGDGKDYFKRFISLSFVAAIRTVVIGLLFSLALAIVNFIAEYVIISPEYFSVWEEISQLVLYALLNVYYYYTLITSFQRINANGENTTTVEMA